MDCAVPPATGTDSRLPPWKPATTVFVIIAIRFPGSLVAGRLSVTSLPRLTVACLRLSLPLTFSALVPRLLAVSTARFPLRRIPALPITVRLASISLVAVEVAICRVDTVRRCAIRRARLTIRHGLVVTIVPGIAGPASGRSRFSRLLTIVGTVASGLLRVLAKFQACGLPGRTLGYTRRFR